MAGVFHAARPQSAPRRVLTASATLSPPGRGQVPAPLGCPTVVNHDRQTAFVRECAAAELGEHAVGEGQPVMASDDMTYFLRERPGCYFPAGIAPADDHPAPHHAPEFEMNEEGLPVGLRVGLNVMLNALGR